MSIRAFCLLVVLSTFGMPQASLPSDESDIVRRLMPDGVPTRMVKLSRNEERAAVGELHIAQQGATGNRSQQIAFLLAALSSEYERNRDFLIEVMRGCGLRPIRNNCDEDTAAFLIALYWRGHHELLHDLLVAGLTSDGALSEILGEFYSDLVLKHPADFLNGIRLLTIPSQKNACQLAGYAGGGGMSPDDLGKVRKSLRAVGGGAALRCIREVENANRDAK